MFDQLERDVRLGDQLLALLAAFLIQAAPLVGEMALKGLRYLLDQIPGTTNEQFLWGAHDILRGIWADHPEWPDERKRQYAATAIVILARDMNVSMDTKLFAELGLA